MDSQAIKVVLNEAQQQASRGNHQAALDMLYQIPSTEGMALRARIFCQQGLFAEGVKRWQALVATNPQDEEARRGLALAQSLAHSPVGKLKLHARRWGLGLSLAAILSTLAVWGLNLRNPAPRTSALDESLRRIELRMADDQVTLHDAIDALKRLESSNTENAETLGKNAKALKTMQAQLNQLPQKIENKLSPTRR